jgi:hypothetical protein
MQSALLRWSRLQTSLFLVADGGARRRNVSEIFRKEVSTRSLCYFRFRLERRTQASRCVDRCIGRQFDGAIGYVYESGDTREGWHRARQPPDTQSDADRYRSNGSRYVSRGWRRWLWRRHRRWNWSPIFSATMLSLQHRFFQFSLVISKQSMDLAMRFVADRVNLRCKLLPRRCRILIEQGLNLVVVLLKQRPDLALLFRSQRQILGKASQFLLD